jgi:hypothetical protein
MNWHTYHVERDGKFTTINSCNDMLGVVRQLYPDLKAKRAYWSTEKVENGIKVTFRLSRKIVSVTEYSL